MSSGYLRHYLVRRRLRPLLLGGLAAFILVEVVAFSPGTLEDSGRDSTQTTLDSETLEHQNDFPLANGIPKNRIPEYSVDHFSFVSSKGSEKQWKLTADKAFLYSSEKLVHTRNVRVLLFDRSNQPTVVTGLEAKYFTGEKERDIEIFGKVKAEFQDGFELTTEYLRFRPKEGHLDVPTSFLVQGISQEESTHPISFESRGFNLLMKSRKVVLPANVRFRMSHPQKKPQNQPNEYRPNGDTVIEADQCVIDRQQQKALFTMNSQRPPTQRFVRITQAHVYARSRRAELNFGNSSNVLTSLSAQEDVLIKEQSNSKSLRYATGGRADFDSKSDVILLSEFPQVYQNNDTVTGEIIKVHRNSDIVEIDQSNAYTDGN